MSPEQVGRVGEAGFGVLLGQIRDDVVFVDRQGKILLTNRPRNLPGGPGFARMGEPDDGFEMFRPDGRRYEVEEWPVLRSVRTGELIDDEEFFVQSPDGSRRSFCSSSAPFYNGDGKIAGAVLVTHEITQQQRSREQLAYLLPMLDYTEDAIIAMDPDWGITAWNKGAERMYGWTAEEVLGRWVPTFVRVQRSDEEREQRRLTLTRDGRLRGEAKVERKDGSTISIESITVALRAGDGEITGYLAIHRDLTERRQATAQLATAGRQQALLADLSLPAPGRERVQPLLERAVAVIADVLGVELCSIAELEPDGQLRWRAAFGWSERELAEAPASPAGTGSLVGYAIMVGEPVVADDLAQEGRFRLTSLLAQRAPVSAAAVVIPGPHEPFGVLAVISREHRPFQPDEVDFVQAVANLIGVAVERADLDKQLDDAREAERSRIARDLHDEGLRELTEALGVATIGRSGTTDEADGQRWAAVTVSLQRLGKQLRGAIYELRLGASEGGVFADLLADLVGIQNGLTPELRVSLHGRQMLPGGSLGSRGAEALPIVREAITNARRHSGTAWVSVDAGLSTRDQVRIDVTDGGAWPDRAATLRSGRGTGLAGMRERAAGIGGGLRIEERPEGGTLVSLTLPLPGVS